MSFPFSFFPSSHTLLRRNWVSRRAKREKGRESWRGGGMFVLFAYVMVVKNVGNV